MRSELEEFGGIDDGTEPTGIETGTTIVAVAGSEGAVLAADRRASLGGRLVTNRSVRKIEPVAERAALAFSGTVGGAQAFLRGLRAHRRRYEQRHGEASVETIATVAGRLIAEGGFGVGLLLAGVDRDESGPTPAVYEIDPAGGVLATEYAASGSGTQLAYGALEGSVDTGGTPEAIEETAIGAVRAASERDAVSGDGVTVARLSGAGVSIEEVA
ncbi:proteasome subunit alpha [Saliphagus sp. LR7]|uniref:proteasome subunit alpha n=1 Tax=Saliphagus sp. LR7 TaxID=2282654 RepID=UPI000DF796EA|nr:proteasome subunit alpha [Saliphagus sp. LR7]